jgi:hypothetical protein
LILGIVPILVVAGLVEGFISPSPFPAAAKFALAGILASLLVIYLSRAGRSPSKSRQQAP